MSEKVNTFNLNRETIKIIFENKLSKNEILILLYVARRMENGGEQVYFKNALVAKNFGVSSENISKAKSALKKKGFIFVQGYYVSFDQSGTSIPFENVFFDFVSKNSFSAAQLKALIFIVRTSHEVRNDKKICFISKTKFNRDTNSSPAVILKIIRMLCRHGLLVNMKKKTERKVLYYRDLSFKNAKSLLVSESKWKLNFNNGRAWKKGESSCCQNRGQKNLNSGSNNCSEMGQISSIKGGLKCAGYFSPTKTLFNDSPSVDSKTEIPPVKQEHPGQIEDSSLTIVNDDFNEDDGLNELREKDKKSELSKRDKKFLDMMETAIKRKNELILSGGV